MAAGSRFFSKLLGIKDTVQSHVLEVAETYMNREEEPGNSGHEALTRNHSYSQGSTEADRSHY